MSSTRGAFMKNTMGNRIGIGSRRQMQSSYRLKL